MNSDGLQEMRVGEASASAISTKVRALTKTGRQAHNAGWTSTPQKQRQAQVWLRTTGQEFQHRKQTEAAAPALPACLKWTAFFLPASIATAPSLQSLIIFQTHSPTCSPYNHSSCAL
eukprot:1146695-Pelagomonas_calceolata.AAC.2